MSRGWSTSTKPRPGMAIYLQKRPNLASLAERVATHGQVWVRPCSARSGNEQCVQAALLVMFVPAVALRNCFRLILGTQGFGDCEDVDTSDAAAPLRRSRWLPASETLGQRMGADEGQTQKAAGHRSSDFGARRLSSYGDVPSRRRRREVQLNLTGHRFSVGQGLGQESLAIRSARDRVFSSARF